MDEFEHWRLQVRQAEAQVAILQETVRTLRADRERERACIEPLLERALRAILASRPHIEVEEREAVLAALRAKLGRKG